MLPIIMLVSWHLIPPSDDELVASLFLVPDDLSVSGYQASSYMACELRAGIPYNKCTFQLQYAMHATEAFQ